MQINAAASWRRRQCQLLAAIRTMQTTIEPHDKQGCLATFVGANKSARPEIIKAKNRKGSFSLLSGNPVTSAPDSM
jgi:hypothetical protein